MDYTAVPVASETHKRIGIRRTALAFAIASLASVYILLIIFGVLPQQQRMDGATVALAGLAALATLMVLWPEILHRITGFTVAGILSFQMSEVKEQLSAHTSELQLIDLMLPLLFPEAERKHLLNLKEGRAETLTASHDLRTRLRRLRSAGLISSKPGTRVGQMVNGSTVDIRDFVELTERGNFWVERIQAMEQERN